MTRPDKRRFKLFSGELSDAPGRCESWTEYLLYLGDDLWEFTTKGTDFSGLGEDEPVCEHWPTSVLLKNLGERDSDLDHKQKLGPRLSALRAYARRAALPSILQAIDEIECDTWPPEPPPPQVIRITGITTVAWPPPSGRGARRTFLTIETCKGAGQMIIPEAKAESVRFWLGAAPCNSPVWSCPLTNELSQQARAVLGTNSKEAKR